MIFAILQQNGENHVTLLKIGLIILIVITYQWLIFKIKFNFKLSVYTLSFSVFQKMLIENDFSF
ncbi:hypothetical protein ADS77_18900 [Pseudoalteromonas porphyrae]|uniref:Uncharacterized protein n=1 Tax=Pseudoalteromonas porphyrae TaxID=187330 RepID=A0A0N1EAP3_9GAMM|nr:hypothetical protein ADS77_18900 [Pseudoalteromonas porphyrae]